MAEDTIKQPVSPVEAAMAGDRSALRGLWTQHRRWVAAVILAHKPSSADLDDLLQDVAITLLAKINTLAEPGAFVPWLRMIALNTARLAGRRHSAGPRLISLDGTGSGGSGGREAGGSGGDREAWEPQSKARPGAPTPPERCAGSEEAERLIALAADLHEDYREPLLLRCVQDLSYRQISAILGLPETTIETRIARARRMLRERASESAGERGVPKDATTKPFLPSHPHSGGGARVRVLLNPDDGA